MVSILFDVDEIKHASRSLFQATVPAFETDLLKRMGCIGEKNL